MMILVQEEILETNIIDTRAMEEEVEANSSKIREVDTKVEVVIKERITGRIEIMETGKDLSKITKTISRESFQSIACLLAANLLRWCTLHPPQLIQLLTTNQTKTRLPPS